MTLATAADANAWLDESKLSMTATDVAQIGPRADAEVIAALIGLFPDDMSLWIDGTNAVPDVIVDIASRLYASAFYAKKYSEETQAPNSYAERLRAQAFDIINGILEGNTLVVDENSVVVVGTIDESELDFWPNNTTVVTRDRNGNVPFGQTEGDKDIKFTTDMVL